MTKSPDLAGDVLSSWWKVAAIGTMAVGFGILILLTVKAYQNAPPIPAKVVDAADVILFTNDDVTAGQQVFLKHGLMDNGTIWGHGAYLGPDFSAQYLHEWALDVADHYARQSFGRSYAELTAEEQATIDGSVALQLKQNRYDPATGTLAQFQEVPEAAHLFMLSRPAEFARRDFHFETRQQKAAQVAM